MHHDQASLGNFALIMADFVMVIARNCKKLIFDSYDQWQMLTIYVGGAASGLYFSLILLNLSWTIKLK